MTLIYFIVAAFFGLIGMAVLRRYVKSETLFSLFSVIIVFLAALMTKNFIVPYYRVVTFEYSLKKDDPTLYNIGSQFPQEYNDYLAKLKHTILTHQNQKVELLDKVMFLNTIFKKTAATASNQSLYNYYGAELALYSNMITIDPLFVLMLEFPGKFSQKMDPRILVTLANPNLLKKSIDTKEAVILSAINNPQTPLTSAEKADAQKSLGNIFNLLIQQYGQQTFADALQNPADPALDKKTAALLIITFYDEVLNTGVNNAGIIFKSVNSPS